MLFCLRIEGLAKVSRSSLLVGSLYALNGCCKSTTLGEPKSGGESGCAELSLDSELRLSSCRRLGADSFFIAVKLFCPP